MLKSVGLFTLFYIAAMLIGCPAPELKKAPIGPEQDLRHGLTIFTGPKRTVVDVNDKNSIARGKVVFIKNCSACHGLEGKGDGPKASELSNQPANLSALARILPNYTFVMQINEGRGEMPMWKDILTTQESWDVSNYIQSLKK